jgi:hypothetical protein
MQDFAHNRALGAILNQFIAKLEKGEESNNAFASLLKSAMATLYGQTLVSIFVVVVFCYCCFLVFVLNNDISQRRRVQLSN